MSRNDVDPFLLEVLKNGLDTIADEMALVLMKTAYSGIVRDSMDFSTAVCDAEGQTLAQGLTTAMHLGSFYDAMRCLITTQAGNIFPDDVFIFNDPYVAAGQHLPDIYIIKPIFYEDQLVAWATTIAHHSDVGGIVPGSNALGADRDLSGRHPHPDRQIHGARQAGRRRLADCRAQCAVA